MHERNLESLLLRMNLSLMDLVVRPPPRGPPAGATTATTTSSTSTTMATTAAPAQLPTAALAPAGGGS